MTQTMGVEQYRALVKAGAKPRMPSDQRKHKNRIVEHGGIKYHSAAELNFKFHLDLLRAQGLVQWYTRQVPFYAPGGKRLVVDYLVCMSTAQIVKGSLPVRMVDVKGAETALAIFKKSVIEATHGLSVEYVKARSSGKYDWI